MLTLSQKARLADALLENYSCELITGYVTDARIEAGCLVGAVYKAWGYRPGERLISGTITEIMQYERRWLIKTREHDCLVVVNFARGGRQALLHLVDLFQTARISHSRWCVH
ncbi:hypothetical protein [Pseudomonas sp. WS 5011]|uniref:hypothetical protein n=1 Tax=Pseudomonas sp. WS 5011 TaxID=2717477 RepID=UPI001474023C|nr:hypothetical protein [Pseudomonas sp. WS 5011]NMY53333.1 hypothetical protein [Pseudomonas sp. WS 5011]